MKDAIFFHEIGGIFLVVVVVVVVVVVAADRLISAEIILIYICIQLATFR